MPRQSVQNLAALYVPNGDGPVTTTDSNPPATIVSAPITPTERTLEAGRLASKHTVDARGRSRKGLDVVND